MAYAKILTTAVILNPVDGATLPSNSIFVDSTNSNSFTNKTDSGTPAEVVAADSNLKKEMENLSGSNIPANTPIAKMPNGSIVRADSDGVNTQDIIGVTTQEIVINGKGLITLIGQNVPSVLTGLGFTPGQEIFLDENGGFTNDVGTALTGGDDSIIKIGIADCISGDANSVVTDLIMFANVLARP